MWDRIKTLLICICATAFLFGCSSGNQVTEPSAQPLKTELPLETADVDPGTFKDDDVEVMFVNVGKADASIIKCGDKAYIIDTGTEQSVPRLFGAINYLGIKSVEAVFLTHIHKDHIGGLSALLDNYTVGHVYRTVFSEIHKKENSIDKNRSESRVYNGIL